MQTIEHMNMLKTLSPTTLTLQQKPVPTRNNNNNNNNGNNLFFVISDLKKAINAKINIFN